MDTPSTWWTEDFVDLTNFTTTAVDEHGNNQMSSVAGESDTNPVMKMDEMNSLMGVPTFAWLEEEDSSMVLSKSNLDGLTAGEGVTSIGKVPSLNGTMGSKVLNTVMVTNPALNFRKPVANSSLVKRRDTQLKLDLTLAANETPDSSPSLSQNIIQISNVPALKKELNLTTPDILGPLTDKNSEFNLLAYVFEEDKFPNDVSKDIDTLNTPEIKPELLETPPTFKSKKEEPLIPIVIKEEPKDIEEVVIDDVQTDFKDTLIVHKGSPTKESKKNTKEPSLKRKPPKPKEKEKVAVVEPRIKIELDEYRPVIFRHKNNSLSEEILFPRKKRKLSTTSEESVYTDDKYRELRDRNNEASRRSRLNRKSREVEMKVQAEQLETTNKQLKTKAEELQKLVDRLRRTLMEVMVRKSS